MFKPGLSLLIVLAVIAGALSAARKPSVQPAAALTQDQKIIHALNRLTFGARGADVAAVKQAGLSDWIESQLKPETIAENPRLEAKLQPLDSLRMSTAEMLDRYPDGQAVKAIVAGRMPMPSDLTAQAIVRIAAERLKEKKGEDGASVNTAPGDVPPLSGSAEGRVRQLQGLTPAQTMAALEPLPRGQRVKIAAAGTPEIRRAIEILNTPTQIAYRDLAEGKLLRAIYSNRQLEEVLTDFWYNHFNVFFNKGADRALVTAYERDAIRPHVLGKFKDLLLATAQSPAMLFYLDNWQSVSADARVNPNQKRRAGLNENYGRELMELHTLGVDGGYTQKDVTEVARCFTGWTILQPRRGGRFIFNARMHDRGAKEVLGVALPAGGGIEDGLKVIDILAHHPSTARFIARSLATRFVSDDPSPGIVERMTATFIATDGDLRQVMRTMLRSPEFWEPGVFRARVKSPLEFVASAVRAVDGDVQNAAGLMGLMTQLGQPLYRKQEPTGYSNRGADWMNSAALLARMNFAGELIRNRIGGVKVDTSRFGEDAPQVERELLLGEPSAASAAAINAGLAERNSEISAKGLQVAALTLGSPDFQRD